jgi:hypothetical protein
VNVVIRLPSQCVQAVSGKALWQELACSVRQKGEAAGQIIENFM